jgi:hypothetical protein
LSIPVDTADAAVAKEENNDGNLGLGHQWVFPWTQGNIVTTVPTLEDYCIKIKILEP